MPPDAEEANAARIDLREPRDGRGGPSDGQRRESEMHGEVARVRLACVANAAKRREIVRSVANMHNAPAEHAVAAHGAIQLAAEARQSAAVCMKLTACAKSEVARTNSSFRVGSSSFSASLCGGGSTLMKLCEETDMKMTYRSSSGELASSPLMFGGA